MGEMVASRSMRMLDDLAAKDEAVCGLVRNEVVELVSALKKTERLLNNSANSRKIMEHMETIRNLGNGIEDLLETWGVQVEAAYIASKNEKKRGIKRWIYGQNDGMAVIKNMVEKFAMDMNWEVRFVNTWFHDTFPEDVLQSERNAVEEGRLENRMSVRWPKKIYAGGVEEHSVEMKEDLNRLVSLVVENQEHRVVSIWGVKGLGKTSLARKVYIHPKVRTRFHGFVWISLGQEYQHENLLQNMLNQLSAGAVKMSADEQKKGEEEKKKGAEDSKTSKVQQGLKKLKRSKKDSEGKKEGVEVQKKKGAGDSRTGRFLHRLRKLGAAVMERINKGKKEGGEEQKKGAEEQQKSSEENMKDQLKEMLRQKSCLIVIDGISDLSLWDDISSEFSVEGSDTRFLLTTCEEEIARVGYTYQLRVLNEDEGWELLQKYVFHGKKAQELGIVTKLGKEMVRKCEGLPSQISSLGRILSNMDCSEWHKVYDDLEGYLSRECQGQSNQIANDFAVPSYDKLLYCLKQCFLYLAIFKEDDDVDLDDLSFLWMAEGIVSSEGSIMNTTENYLRKLALEGMLQVKVDELSENRKFKKLCLNNNMREISLFQGEKEGFRLKLVDFSDGKQPRFDSFSLFDGTRRLVIHFNKLSSPWEYVVYATSYLRSLFFLNSSQECVHLPVRIPDFKEFTLLRVLHFVRCKFEGRELPDGIDKLFNLTYLGVLYCDLDRLPPSLSNVRNLHVLNVRAYHDARITIPNAILKMDRLKHLRLPNSLDHELSDKQKVKLDGLLDLETLFGFNADIHDVESLSKLEKLRHLTTHASSNDALESVIKFVKSHGDRVRTNLLIDCKCDFTSEQGLTILEEVLMCPNMYALRFSMVLMHKLPNCGRLASKELTEIKLIGSKLCEDPMEALGKFPKLHKLCLGYGAFVGRHMVVGDTGFPELEYLEFRGLPNLEEWSVNQGAMKKLSALTIKQCPKLKRIPQEFVSSIKNHKIDLPPNAIARVCEKTEFTFQIFSSNHILKSLGSFILDIWMLTKKLRNAICQES